MTPATTPPAVLLLHGFGGSATRTWRDNGWLDLLADAGRTTIAPDLPGHGPGSHSHDPGAYATVEADVLAHLDGTDVVDAIGFSMGAKVLLSLAAAAPGRFRRIVVAGVGANLFRDDGRAFLVAALRGAGEGNLSDDPTARYFQQLATSGEADPLALAAFLERPGSPTLTPEVLGAITAPVLVVLGDADFAGPADPLVACIPGAAVEILKGTDHFSTPKSFGFIDAALDFIHVP